MQLTTTYWLTTCLAAVTSTGVPDLLSNGAMSAEELASAASLHPRSLYRMLRALTVIGAFAEDSSKRFSLTPLSELLRKDHPASSRDLVLFMNDKAHNLAYAEALNTLRTGQTGIAKAAGMEVFEYFQQHEDQRRQFDGAMLANSHAEMNPVAEAYNFDNKSIADIGGGRGHFVNFLLERNPAATGILFDLPPVVEEAQRSNLSCAERIEFRGGSFFDALPADADIYLLKHIVHDWDDARVVPLLRSCRDAMKPGAKLLVVELVLPDGPEPHPGKVLDIEMLILAGGVERTAAEYTALLSGAGLRVERIIPTRSPISIVEAAV